MKDLKIMCKNLDKSIFNFRKNAFHMQIIPLYISQGALVIIMLAFGHLLARGLHWFGPLDSPNFEPRGLEFAE